MNFDLSTNDKMYCAEMIAKAVEDATSKRISFFKEFNKQCTERKISKKITGEKNNPFSKNG